MRGGVKERASGGEGGEATLGKSTSKADGECDFPLVPRGKSHSPLVRASPDSSEGIFLFPGSVLGCVTGVSSSR